MNAEHKPQSQPDVLRGNVEAGLRLLLKSEKEIYRAAARVGMEDLKNLFEQLEAAGKRAEGFKDEAVAQQDRWLEECDKRAGLEEQLEATQRALADAVDVAIWLTGLPCLNPESEAWPYWESGARPKLYKAMELLDSNPASKPSP